MTTEWEFSDDPSDPCPYDVQWEPWEDPENAKPVWPNGSVAPRIYRFVHEDCEAAVIAYVSETGA